MRLQGRSPQLESVAQVASPGLASNKPEDRLREIRSCCMAAADPDFASAQPGLLAAPALPAPDYSTMRVGFRVTGRDTLWKFGEVAITASWISANCALVPLPLTRTT